jgi:ABC-type glutathione transport system ATPase component
MESQTPPLLTVEHLTLSLNAEVKIHDLSFTLHAGERLCLLGASGSGKSLTAAAILGTLPVGQRLAVRFDCKGEKLMVCVCHGVKTLIWQPFFRILLPASILWPPWVSN